MKAPRYVWVRHHTGTAHLHLVLTGLSDYAASRARCGRPGAGAQEPNGNVKWGCTRCARAVPDAQIIAPFDALPEGTVRAKFYDKAAELERIAREGGSR